MKYKNCFFLSFGSFAYQSAGTTTRTVEASLLWYGGILLLCDPQFTGVSSVSESRCSADDSAHFPEKAEMTTFVTLTGMAQQD